TTSDIANNSPPNKFKLLLPIDGFIDAPLAPSLSWEGAVDPDGHKIVYDAYLGKVANPKGMILFNSQSTSFSIPNNLEYETTYYWYVQAIDEKGAVRNSAVFSFKTIEEPGSSSPPKWKKITSTAFQNTTGRYGHQVVEMDGKVWLIGGKRIGTSNSGTKNDVWTYDGSTWTEVKGHDDDQLQSFYASDESQVVAFKNNLWVFVGTRNNIHKSSDGVSWENVKVKGSVIDTSHWKGKHGHQVVVHDGKMWVIGGTNGGVASNDVWSSTDGETWEKVKVYDPTGFTPRTGHSAVSFKGKLWVIGGIASGTASNDVWSSGDGKNWTQELSNAPFSARTELECKVFKNHLFVISGSNKDDVWYSADGKTWKEMQKNPLYKGRLEHSSVLYNDELLTFFGKENATPLNDIWAITW
ncbi:MAG: Kelch repeat-containing protein, partial [Bacteroidia bacterium]